MRETDKIRKNRDRQRIRNKNVPFLGGKKSYK